MEYVTQKRLVIWGFLILIIINLSTLGTIAYYRFFKPQAKVVRVVHKPGSPMPKNIVCQELNLTRGQRDQFNQIRINFRNKSTILTDSLEKIRYEIVMELSMDKPNLERLDQLAENIGTLHTQLKKESITHLLELKTIFTPEQHRQFTNVFFEHFKTRGYCPGPGQGLKDGQGPKNRHERVKFRNCPAIEDTICQ